MYSENAVNLAKKFYKKIIQIVFKYKKKNNQILLFKYNYLNIKQKRATV